MHCLPGPDIPIGELLRSWRERVAMTQEAAALALPGQITQAHLSALERGTRRPSLEMVRLLAPLYGLTLPEFGRALVALHSFSTAEVAAMAATTGDATA